MEIPIVREEGQQGLRQFDGADANHDIVEYRIREIWAISVLVSLAIRDAVGIVHDQDEIRTFELHLLPDGVEELIDSRFILQFTGLKLTEETASFILNGDGKLVVARRTSQRLFECRQVVLGFALREGQRRL